MIPNIHYYSSILIFHSLTRSERPKLRQSTIQATAEVKGISERRRRQAASDGYTGETGKSASLTSELTAIKRRAILAEIAQRKNVPEVRRLTQEELLAEAKITEEINRRSLG
ncbi:unnamed protein product [Protopolystoma xenopodis]|uniref:Uncharacterized protein n=1 Tax=Protopolystoma xenopodis TaxID=117903 RepID=A0A448WNU1_9PLAT|nr:unnamed protein product [Protopolystoma xenopodis]